MYESYLFTTFKLYTHSVYNLVGATNPYVEHYSGLLCMYLWQLMSKYNAVLFIWHNFISKKIANGYRTATPPISPPGGNFQRKSQNLC